ncbi:MAG: hypothetical protein GY856_37985 [bacterium]|nr:hypothetical protein [bacterium]
MKRLSTTGACGAIALGALMMSFGPALAAKKPIAARDFQLSKKGSDRVELTLEQTGTITVRASVKEPATNTPLRLLVEGPGDVRLEKTGPAPLKLRHQLAYPRQQGTWRATVINVSKIGWVTGKLRVFFEPWESEQHADPGEEPGEAEAGAGSAAPPEPASAALVRAACRDKNQGVAVRLDMERGTGALYMSSHHVFSLESSRVSENLIELRGNGEHPLYLDKNKETLYFKSGEKGEFCKVRIDYGES